MIAVVSWHHHLTLGRDVFAPQPGPSTRRPLKTGTTLRPQIFGGLQRGFVQTAVFLNPETDSPYTPTRVSMAFQRTCQSAGLSNACSHDLRHTFVTNARGAKIDNFRIMAITEHKILRVFQRYNLIEEGNLQEAMTTLQGYLTDHEMDTSLDTNTSEAITSRRKNVMNPRR